MNKYMLIKSSFFYFLRTGDCEKKTNSKSMLLALVCEGITDFTSADKLNGDFTLFLGR